MQVDSPTRVVRQVSGGTEPRVLLGYPTGDVLLGMSCLFASGEGHVVLQTERAEVHSPLDTALNVQASVPGSVTELPV